MWVRGYRRDWLGSDLIAGAVAACVVVPQAIAYASLAGLPVQLGLYAALVGMLVYAFLGSSRPLSVSVTSTIAIITATAVAGSNDPAATAALLAILAILAGGLLLIAGIVHLGFLAELISLPILSGYKAGIGLVILSSQLGKVFGTQPWVASLTPDEQRMMERYGGEDGLLPLFASPREAVTAARASAYAGRQ